MDGEREHDGFISYAHAPDSDLARQLQTGLQGFAKPWWRRRALRVFRDESGLSANPHLWSAIATALESSEWLVLLLSPDAARSDWVGREITHWLQTRPAARILPVLTEGELVWDDARGDFDGERSTAVPPSLVGVFHGEPRWVDLRWAHGSDHLDLANPRFRAAVADIAAPLHGVAKDEPRSLAWLPDGRLLADVQVGDDPTTEGPRIVDPVTGSSTAAAASGTNDFALSPDGSSLVAVRLDDRGAFSETVVASRVGSPSTRPHTRDVGSPAVWVTRCGPYACVLTTDKQMLRVRFGDASIVSRVAMPSETVVDPNLLTVNQWVAASPDGTLVAAPSSDNVVRLVDPATGRVARVLGGTTRGGSVLAFSSDGRQVAGRDDTTVLVWHLDGAPLPERYDGHGGRISTAMFSPDGRTLVSTAEDRAMIAWDLSGTQRVGRVLTRALGATTSSLWAAGDEVAVGQSTGSLLFVDPDTGTVSPAEGGSPSDDGAGLSTVRSGDGGDRLIAASYSGRTTIWSLREHRLLEVVTGLPPLDEKHVSDTWVSRDGRWAATERDDSGITVIDMTSGLFARTLPPLPATTFQTFYSTVVGWTADGTGILAVRQTDDPAGVAELFVVDATTGAVRTHRSLPWLPIEAVESPAGDVLAVGGDTGQVAFLDPATGLDIAPAGTANDRAVYNMAASPDGRWFSASGGPPQVTLWDAHSFTNVGGPLPVDVDARDARARFDRDGGLVVTTGGTLRIFDVDPAGWMARACTEAGRSLTQDEWDLYLPTREYEPACPTAG